MVGALVTVVIFEATTAPVELQLTTLPAFALGTHFITHGIWSLTSGRPPRHPHMAVLPQVSSTGAGLVFAGSFEG